MSQLDISIFYNHLFDLLLVFYIFSNSIIIILINFYYNVKLRELKVKDNLLKEISSGNILIINKILE